MEESLECLQAHVAAPIRRVERCMAWASLLSLGKALLFGGLIHANHYDQETKAYLLEQLHNAQATEVDPPKGSMGFA